MQRVGVVEPRQKTTFTTPEEQKYSTRRGSMTLNLEYSQPSYYASKDEASTEYYAAPDRSSA